MTTVSVKYTYQDLLTTPDDRNRYEIFEGDLVVTPAPSADHQIAVSNLHRLFSNFVAEQNRGRVLTAPMDVYFDEETVVEPDILFIAKDRLSILEKHRVNGAPDLIVEVLSPSTEDRDRGFKFKRCAQEGVKEYWLVDPEKHFLEVYTLTSKGYELLGKFSGEQAVKSKVFSELEFPASEVWK
ncbi:MAG: Uma2 family endonuclease [Bacteroidota bacterium]